MINGVDIEAPTTASAAISTKCEARVRLIDDYIDGPIEGVDIGQPGGNGASPNFGLTRTYINNVVTGVWFHTVDDAFIDGGGIDAYADRGVVIGMDENNDTLTHGFVFTSNEGSSIVLSSVTGIDVGNADAWTIGPGTYYEVLYQMAGGYAVRLSYWDDAKGGSIIDSQFSGSGILAAISSNSIGSSGEVTDLNISGNHIVSWGNGIDLGGTTTGATVGANNYASITGANAFGAAENVDGGYYLSVPDVLTNFIVARLSGVEFANFYKILGDSNPLLSFDTSGILIGLGGSTAPTRILFTDGSHRDETYTVAALPTCNSTNKGKWFTVSDSTAVATEGQACAGSSTSEAAAFCSCNGSAYSYKCF